MSREATAYRSSSDNSMVGAHAAQVMSSRLGWLCVPAPPPPAAAAAQPPLGLRHCRQAGGVPLAQAGRLRLLVVVRTSEAASGAQFTAPLFCRVSTNLCVGCDSVSELCPGHAQCRSLRCDERQALSACLTTQTCKTWLTWRAMAALFTALLNTNWIPNRGLACLL